MNTDDLIRESLKKQADLAPPPHAVLAALRRPRRNWTPLVIAIAATASVLAAVVVTLRPVDSAQPATPPATTAPDRSSGGVVAVPLRFEPQWVPDGFVERWRTLGHGGHTRTWADPADSTRIVQFGVDPSGSEHWTMYNAQYEGSADQVDIGAKWPAAFNTTPGSGSVDSTRAELFWAGTDGEQLRVKVENVPDARAVAERFAESLAPDSGSVHAPVLTLAPEYAERSAALDRCYNKWTGTSPTDWTIEVRIDHFDRVTAVRLSTTAPDTTGGRPVRARGADATFVPAKRVGDDWSDVMVVVPVGDRFLTVAGESFLPVIEGSAREPSELSEETLIDIATSTKIADHPDVSWFGTT